MIGTMTLTDEISGRMTSSGLFQFSLGGWPGLEGRRREADDTAVSIPMIVYILPVEQEKSTCQATAVFPSLWETVFTPRTDLGKRLYFLRTRAVIAGMKLISEEEVLEKVKRRRGEIENDETNLY